MAWGELATLIGVLGSLVGIVSFGAHQVLRYGQLVESQRDQGRQIGALVEQTEWLRKELGNLKVDAMPRQECYMQMRDAQRDIVARLDRLEGWLQQAGQPLTLRETS